MFLCAKKSLWFQLLKCLFFLLFYFYFLVSYDSGLKPLRCHRGVLN